jgi:hypothetical protein
MRPGFTAAERFAAVLEEAASRKMPATDPAVVPAKAELPKPETITEVAAVDYNSESFPLFASRVNAILLNACASCHARDDAKAFRLTRVGGRSGATKNMMAALPHVNPKDPAASAILTKAVTPHGTGTEAPFKTRSHPAFQALEIWANFARAPDGTAAPERTQPAEPRKLPDLEPAAARSPAKAPPSSDGFGQDSNSVPGKPVKNQAADPFDPAIFNGEVKKK